MFAVLDCERRAVGYEFWGWLVEFRPGTKHVNDEAALPGRDQVELGLSNLQLLK